MLFDRRSRLPLADRLRSLLWPKRGFTRGWKYLLARLTRIKATPHAIAAGFASGVAVSFTPFLGFHFLISFAIAFLLRGSLLAAALGTAVGNPLTFPLIFALTYQTGARLLNWGAQEALPIVNSGDLVPADDEAAEAAAETLLEAPETLLETGVYASGFEAMWPLIRTMSIGALPLGTGAFLISYVLVRALMRAFERRRGDKGPPS